MSLLKERLKAIDKELGGAINRQEITLVAVTKYANDEQVLEAYQLGLRIFAENYIIPAIKRQERLAQYFTEPVAWHLIGPIQSNKINKVVGNFDLIQSVGSYETAELISKRAQQLGITQQVLIQINNTGDKNGFTPEAFRESIPEILKLTHIEVRGLMTMGPHKSSAISETIFSNMRQLNGVLKELRPSGAFELSMGMTNDYRLAFQNGATMIRLGRGLFAREVIEE